MGDQVKKTRTKAKTKDGAVVLEAGKGVSTMVSQNLRRPVDYLSIVGNSKAIRRSIIVERLVQGHRSHRKSLIYQSGIATLSALLDMDEYEFPEDDNTAMDPSQDALKLDVTALDRYNDDIRKLRRMCVDECRNFPHKGEPDEGTSRRLRGIIRSLCRTSFFGTHKAQVLAEGTVILIVWLLNKKNVSSSFKVHVLQSFAEMVWCSDELKYALYRCNGMRILAKLLVKGVIQRSDQVRWACYTLAMACIGCKEIIESVKSIPELDEVVGEVAFHAYWANWPANFGQILQGILFGPHSVIPVEDAYQFL